MARRVEQIEVSTVEVMDLSVQEPIGGWQIYNGREDWFECQVNGRFFHFPPDLGDDSEVEHPIENDKAGNPLMVKANGLLRIVDVVGRAYVQTKNGPTSIPTNSLKQINGSREVATFIINNYGKFGLCLMSGTIQDARKKENAKKLFVESQREKDKQDVGAYEASFASWRKNHPDQTPNPPPESIRLAKERLDEYEASRQSVYMYVCPCGTHATNNFESYARHNRVNHGKIVKPNEIVEETPAKRGPGRPPKTVEAEA